MKTYTPEELAAMIGGHKKWIKGEECGSRADLRGANLRDADLSGAVGLPEKIKGFRALVAKTILENPAERLNMENWHTCETTHCIAGWAVHLAQNGRYLESQMNTPGAARCLLGLLDKGEDSLFYRSNYDVIDTLREWASEEKESLEPTDNKGGEQ